jgi:hypothetical protein
MIKNTVTVLIVIVVILSLASISYAEESDNSGIDRRTVIDSDSIVYGISFSATDSNVRIYVNNPTDRNGEHTGYSILIDGQRVHDADFRLDRNEQRTEKVNITPGIDVNRDEHTVAFYTYGNSTKFNFTREIASTDSGKVPTPYISNVEITDGTIDGEPSAVANVTLVNPSKQLYSTKLMVHTVGTDGSLYPASVRPESSRTITVELLDDEGAEIAGEARLYTGNMTTKEGAMDQVEFAGQAGEGTQVWNSSYEPVRPTWMKDNYEYQNASYSQGLVEKASGGHEIRGVPIIYAVVGLLVGWIGVRKYR